MDYLFIIFTTVLSCMIFEFSSTIKTTKALIVLYKNQFKVLGDNKADEDEKQKLLLNNVSLQLKSLFILTSKLVFFLSPFIILYFSKGIINFDFSKLVSIIGVIISTLTVVGYISVKTVYAKLFNS